MANDSGPTQLLSKAVAYILRCGLLLQLTREIALRYFYLAASQQARLEQQLYSILKYKYNINTEHRYKYIQVHGMMYNYTHNVHGRGENI